LRAKFAFRATSAAIYSTCINSGSPRYSLGSFLAMTLFYFIREITAIAGVRRIYFFVKKEGASSRGKLRSGDTIFHTNEAPLAYPLSQPLTDSQDPNGENAPGRRAVSACRGRVPSTFRVIVTRGWMLSADLAQTNRRQYLAKVS